MGKRITFTIDQLYGRLKRENVPQAQIDRIIHEVIKGAASLHYKPPENAP